MPLLLRKIRLARWHREEQHDLSWVPRDDIVADPLADLTTTGGRLSVWRVADDLSNLERVLAAFAATADRTSILDYVLFDPALLPPLGVALEHTPGDTPDPEANELWHSDLTRLSGRTVVELARAIKAHGREGTATARHLRQLIALAIDAGQVDWDRLNDGIRKEFAR